MVQARTPIRILFVCMGNICRSPLAEGVFRAAVEGKELGEYFEIDSAGTGSWHVGQPPDLRMQTTAEKYGVSIASQTARQFVRSDLRDYDHIFVMDRDNLHDVSYLDESESYSNKVRLFREVDPEPGDYQVPDPYYGGDKGFDHVYGIVHRTAHELLDRLVDEYHLT